MPLSVKCYIGFTVENFVHYIHWKLFINMNSKHLHILSFPCEEWEGGINLRKLIIYLKFLKLSQQMLFSMASRDEAAMICWILMFLPLTLRPCMQMRWCYALKTLIFMLHGQKMVLQLLTSIICWVGQVACTTNYSCCYREHKIRRNMLTTNPMQGQVWCCQIRGTLRKREENHMSGP